MADLSKTRDSLGRRTHQSRLTPSQIDLINREGEAIEEAVAWHTVGIVADDGQSIGTGTAILWRQHSLILTARHVIEGSPDDDIWFYFRDEGTMKRSPIDELPNRRDVEYRSRVKIKIVGRCCLENADLAALEVERPTEEEHPVRFFELAQDSATPPSGTIINMRGYPFDLSRVVSPGSRAAFAMLQWSQIQETPRLHRFDPASEFLTRFVAADQGKHAPGFSGSGAWFENPSSGVWSPRLGLAGVCTHYYRRPKLLSLLRIEQVTRFLKEAFPT
jgi:trypsin-like peptidase